MIVSARGLTKKFGNTVAVKDVNLEIPPGESLFLSGGNGSGKTTLLRMLAGLTRPTSGAVSIGGAAPREVRQHIGFLGHESYIYPYLSPAENLTFYAKLFDCEDRGPEMLEKFGLKEKADAPSHTLSRGQLQRLGIARALLHRPKVLLLDEPFTGLDPEARSAARAAISETRASTLITGHDGMNADGGPSAVMEEGHLR